MEKKIENYKTMILHFKKNFLRIIKTLKNLALILNRSKIELINIKIKCTVILTPNL